jgi:hypothetical protein
LFWKIIHISDKIWGNLTNHEESVIGAGANHSNFDTVFRVPLPLALEDIQHSQRAKTYPCKAIENVNIVTRVQIIDSTFTIDFESIWRRTLSRC